MDSLNESLTTATTKRRGRPRSFDTDSIIDRSVEVFWEHGFAGTTTRTLEDSLGISQSSLYNAFGSKEELFDQVVARYEARLDDAVLRHLDPSESGDVDDGRDQLCLFIEAVSTWVRLDKHRGCLVLNLAAGSDEGAERVKAYRTRLRKLIGPVITSFTDDPDEVGPRTELLITAVLGLNISAKGGASSAELKRLTGGITHQIRSW